MSEILPAITLRTAPPFRAEHIGSLLRPAALLELRRLFARGEITRTELTEAENRAIEDAIRRQEKLGLKLATDGEFRRQSYHGFFYSQLGDVSLDAPAPDNSDGRAAQPMATIKSRLEWTHPIHVDDFTFLRSLTHALLDPQSILLKRKILF